MPMYDVNIEDALKGSSYRDIRAMQEEIMTRLAAARPSPTPHEERDKNGLTGRIINIWVAEQTQKFGPVVYRKRSVVDRVRGKKPRAYYWDDAIEVDSGQNCNNIMYDTSRLPAQVYVVFKEWERGNYPKWVDRSRLCEKRLENL